MLANMGMGCFHDATDGMFPMKTHLTERGFNFFDPLRKGLVIFNSGYEV